MGHSDFWNLSLEYVDNPEKQHGLELELVRDLHCEESYRSKAPWLLIDWSNLKSIASESGGSFNFINIYQEKYLEAIFQSAYRIHVFIDGSQHDAKRAVIKLDRLASVTKEPEFIDSGGNLNLLLKYLKTKYNFDISVYRTTRSESGVEADSEIRKFARKFLSSADDPDYAQEVIIMSEDASLLIGIHGNVSMTNPRYLTLKTKATVLYESATASAVDSTLVSMSITVLNGPIIRISNFISILIKECKEYVLYNKLKNSIEYNDFTIGTKSLTLIFALIDGNHSHDDHDKDSNPFNLIRFIAYLSLPSDAEYDDFKKQPKYMKLIYATILIYIYHKNDNYVHKNFNNFRVILNKMKLICDNRSVPPIDFYGLMNRGYKLIKLPNNKNEKRQLCKITPFFLTSSLYFMDNIKLIEVLNKRLNETNDENIIHTQKYLNVTKIWNQFQFISNINYNEIIQPFLSFMKQLKLVNKINSNIEINKQLKFSNELIDNNLWNNIINYSIIDLNSFFGRMI